MRLEGARERTPAVLAGLAVSFTAAVWMVRAVRPALLLEGEPSWAASRLLLSLSVIGLATLAGGLAASLFFLWSRTATARDELTPLDLSRASLGLIAAAALLAGTLLRLVALDRVPESLWIDDASLIAPTLALEGRPADFADAVRAAPHGIAKPYGSVGVLYLEVYRASLRVFGTTVRGIRMPSALAGCASLATAFLLARALLPRGGATLAVLALSGLRWSLILSRWGWVQIVLAPIADLACLLALAARRRSSAAAALGAGALAGLGAHVYLSAWVLAAGLALFAGWPEETVARRPRRLRMVGLVLLGFALAAAPLFLFRKGREAPYFARAGDHNVATEMSRERSLLPPLAAAADTIAAPWLLPDSSARNDLPGKSRLGWVLGLPLLVCLGRCLIAPRRELSALLLSQAAAALLASIAAGQADIPNGARFAYLTGLTAMAVSAGTLALVGAAPVGRRRVATLLAVGAIAISGALGARDALGLWPERRETFDGFHGQDTLIGRAAARWEERGDVLVQPGLGHSDILVTAVRRYRLGAPPPAAKSLPLTARRFRIVDPHAPPEEGERVVERIGDGWGRPWAVVLGRSEARR
jgi:hypothetical protein